MENGFREGHYYLVVRKHGFKDKVVDCGDTYTDVKHHLDLLNDDDRVAVIKGFFRYNEGLMEKWVFLFGEKGNMVVGINKRDMGV
jgi:hypothetical protein